MTDGDEAELEYWKAIREAAARHGFDGCTGVTNARRDCCLEHDYHFRFHTTLDGLPITRSEADARFRACLQRRSRCGYWSPMAWWRWLGLKFNRTTW